MGIAQEVQLCEGGEGPWLVVLQDGVEAAAAAAAAAEGAAVQVAATG